LIGHAELDQVTDCGGNDEGIALVVAVALGSFDFFELADFGQLAQCPGEVEGDTRFFGDD